MPTVHRYGNLRFVVFFNDHDPPHVHVFSGSGEAKVLLGSPGVSPSIEWARRFNRPTLRKILLETMTHRARLLWAWHSVHGEERHAANAEGIDC
ncbi:MAG TPA: DUF4160 domain-containing protein [Reyranella sp.]|jgi:hypothetical protein|nr:DUF4160 domain-containing protein [Reyranella sp.]